MKNIENIKIAGLVLMTISLPFSVSLKTAGIIIAAAVLLIQLIRKESYVDISLISHGLILLFFSSLISTVFAHNVAKSFKGAMDVIKYVLVFFIANSVHKENDIRKILWGLYISTALASVFGIIHSIEIHKGLEIHSLGNQNYTAMFLLTVITSMLSNIAFSEKESNSEKYAIVTLAVIILVASVMTVMRATFIAFFSFLIILLFSRVRKKTILIFVMSVALTALVVYINKAMWLKLFSIKSMITRVDMWKHAIDYFLENPVVGIGLNNFVHTLPGDFPVDPGGTVYDAHSLYFQTASQMGIIGLLALSLIIIGFIRSWKNLKVVYGFDRALKFGAMGAFLVVTVTGLFDTTLHHEHAIAFTMVTGLMFGCLERPQKTDGI